jgi:butyryl-CoA dehydrogenase
MKKITGIDILDERIKEKLTTENIFKIFNQFVIPLISKPEHEFLNELEDYMLNNIEPKINLNNDVYELFPELGKVNLMQRLNPYSHVRRKGMRYEIILAMVTSLVDPELDLARVVSGLIFTNPIFQHGQDKPRCMEILDEVLSGKKIGCICITEKDKGSDAVNMDTQITKKGDDIVISGEKIFTTNGPMADYFIVYGCTDSQNPRGTMYQAIVERDFEGVKTERLGIQSIPRVHVGKTILDSVVVPKENILGTAGQGYNNLFSGLVAERMTIVGSSLGISWLTAITSFIYTNLREQFGKPIYKFQGVSLPLSALFTELVAATELGFKAATIYEKSETNFNQPKWVKFNAAFSSGTKYLASNLAHRISYEAQQLCGGIAFTDNLRIDRALEVAKVQEVIGGARNIQLLLVSKAIKDMIKKL